MGARRYKESSSAGAMLASNSPNPLTIDIIPGYSPPSLPSHIFNAELGEVFEFGSASTEVQTKRSPSQPNMGGLHLGHTAMDKTVMPGVCDG